MPKSDKTNRHECCSLAFVIFFLVVLLSLWVVSIVEIARQVDAFGYYGAWIVFVAVTIILCISGCCLGSSC